MSVRLHISALIFCGMLAAALFVQCSMGRKITYHIPPDLPAADRKILMGMLDKGQALYKAHCTGCHGVFNAPKDGVPDFTNLQIDNYSARFIRRDPQNHAVFIKMSPEQLEQILVFLRYKNPQNKDSLAARKTN